MTALSISISTEALERLQRASLELGRTVEDLAESAVEEAALEWSRGRPAPRPLTDAEIGARFLRDASPGWMR